MSLLYPLISCICVTRGKPDMLKRAIGCFSAQTYPNKELIVLYEEDDQPTKAFITDEIKTISGIRFFEAKATPRATLGELRNQAIGLAHGEFICQWDDDDWYHMNRLIHQYQTLRRQGRDGSIMTRWLVMDATSGNIYISNTRLWEGSILCRKRTLQLKAYENKHIGEDTATIDYLAAADCLDLLHDRPGLYIYIYHGGNTWNYEHWRFIFKCSTALMPEDSKIVSEVVQGKYTVEMGSLMIDEILECQYSNNE
ncbi:MAG TPA: glycosyltransferase family A protein [Puia sp.]|nr:glycosyltransferase family A protein [Puia sp.]